jgi:beta-glucosidase
LAIAKEADTVILALGEINTEGEGHDRPDIVLDQAQLSLASGAFALGKPTLLLLSNGCSIALDGLIGGSDAIVETFDPVRSPFACLTQSTASSLGYEVYDCTE